MSHAHIGGERGRAFLDLVGPTAPERVLLIGIDVAKSSWFAMGADLLGNVVLPGCKLMAFAIGLEHLKEKICEARERTNAQLVIVGIEATGHLHQALAAHLADVDGIEVRLLNPAAVAAVRSAQLNRRRKTDELDAAAICELLRRGEGSPTHLDGPAASTLRVLWNGRKDLVDTRADLHHRVYALVDCLWPGMTARDTKAGLRPLFCRLFEIKATRVIVELLAEGWTPQRFAATTSDELRTVFAARNCRLVRPTAARIIARAEQAIPPHPAATVGKQDMLAVLLAAIGTLDMRIAEIEERMAELLASTQGAKLTQIRGVGVVAASGVVAFIGHTDRWQRWAQVWRAAGLDPARSQSGPRDNAYGISREGGLGTASHPRSHRQRAATTGPPTTSLPLRPRRGKPSGIAMTAEANKLGRLCFALMATGGDYDEQHVARRSATKENAA